MASPRGSWRVGTMFGPYQLRSLIGVGGMGEVFAAYDTVKDRIVAVKLLRPELAGDASFQERFRRESRVAARLHDPHVIPVHDWGDIGGALYIDMRLVKGINLKDVLRRDGPLQPARAAAIVTQVASALDAAHADGLIHRDVKPENVLLTANDFAYLVDFGIVRGDGDPALTMTGAAIGSGVYMAPERFTGARVGPQADVYSLACVLYECLTGRTPFPMVDLGQLMSAHMLAPPPRPSLMRADLNPAFDDVVARGMAKHPAGRFSSAGQLASVAAAAAAAAPVRGTRQFSAVHTSAAGIGRGRKVLVAAAIAAFAVSALLAVFLVVRNNNAAHPANLALPRGPDTPATSSPATTTAPPTTAAPPTTTTGLGATTQPLSLTGTDGQGFVGSFARCDQGDSPALMARTTASLVVVCQAGPANFYYRGVRVSDGASIELADAVRSAGGFDVTNPADGTRYQVRPNQLNIISPSGRVYSESMVHYTSR